MDEHKLYYEIPGKGTERRRFLRISANFITTYYPYPHDIDKRDVTLSRNISVGGICFTTDTFFVKGTILYIALRLPKITKLIEMLGEVVFTQKEEHKLSLYDIGVKFIRVEEDDLFILERIIRECASSEKKPYFAVSEQQKKQNKKQIL